MSFMVGKEHNKGQYLEILNNGNELHSTLLGKIIENYNA